RSWRTAHDMVAGFASVLTRWTATGGALTGLGIGIASGEAILGNIGSPHYMSHTIIGDAVNIAARLVQAAKPGEVLASGAVYAAIRDQLPPAAKVSHDQRALRGKSGTTDVYSI